MSIKNRIKKLERNSFCNLDEWLERLSDEELDRIVTETGGGGLFARWLKTLTDGELNTLRYEQTGANTLRRKYDEFQKPTKEN